MPSQPLVSILIANYNNTQYLPEAIESIYQQTYTNWEIVIVDDYSTDNPVDIYENLKENQKIRIFINDENYGVGYTKGKCIELANGEICGFLDPDDTLTKDALEKMVNSHLSHPECSLVHSKLYYCDENMNCFGIYPSAKNVPHNEKDFFNLNGEITQLTTFKKSFYNKTEGIDKFLKRAADQDLYIKLYEVGATFYLDEALYYYRQHSNSISLNANASKALYWHWYAIFKAITRRNLNFENDFFKYFVLRSEYNKLLNEHKKLWKYNKIDKALRKIKSIFNHTK